VFINKQKTSFSFFSQSNTHTQTPLPNHKKKKAFTKSLQHILQRVLALNIISLSEIYIDLILQARPCHALSEFSSDVAN
jgi:hypothetical protein